MKRSNRKLITGIALIIFFLCLVFNQLSCSAVPGNNTTRVFGLIEAKANNLYLIENWLSRSRVTYLIKGGLARRIKKYNNSLAIISVDSYRCQYSIVRRRLSSVPSPASACVVGWPAIRN